MILRYITTFASYHSFLNFVFILFQSNFNFVLLLQASRSNGCLRSHAMPKNWFVVIYWFLVNLKELILDYCWVLYNYFKPHHFILKMMSELQGLNRLNLKLFPFLINVSLFVENWNSVFFRILPSSLRHGTRLLPARQRRGKENVLSSSPSKEIFAR